MGWPFDEGMLYEIYLSRANSYFTRVPAPRLKSDRQVILSSLNSPAIQLLLITMKKVMKYSKAGT